MSAVMLRCAWLCLGVLGTGVTTGHAAVYKCADRTGAVSYQQRPCPPDAPAAGTPASEASLHDLAQVGKLAIGMGASDVKLARGVPTRIVGNGRDGPESVEQWIYAKQGEQVLSVTLRDGRVVNWSDLGSQAGTIRP
jgi:Domain of unknown function (DUF4124)